jgi:hypothetical protein
VEEIAKKEIPTEANKQEMISFRKVVITPTKERHLPALWNILREWPELIPREDIRENLSAFHVWFHEKAKDSLTGLDKGKVIGCAYLASILFLYVHLSIFPSTNQLLRT